MVLCVEVFREVLDGVEFYVQEFDGGIVIARAGYDAPPAGLEGVRVKYDGNSVRRVAVSAQEVPDTGEGLFRLETFGVEYLIGSLREPVDGVDYVLCFRIYHNDAKIPLFYRSLVMSLIISSSMSR